VSKGKILIVENFGADFFQSRTALAKSLINQGYEVHALIPNDGFGDKLVELGIHVNSYSLDRSNKGIIQILKLIFFYRQLFQREQFDIIHSFRFQPNLISCFAKLRISKSKLILHITGLGIAFSSSQFKFLVYKFISQCIYLFKFYISDVIIVQNPDDAKTLFASSIFPSKIHLIEGSGVDIQKFIKTESNIRTELGISKDSIIFTCITRLIWEKGIRELLVAFDKLIKLHPECKLILVGWPDIDNPQHIPLSYFNSWKDSTHVFFLGKRKDISSILSGSDIYIYPSYYREGIPRSILEALSIGLPILTTNTCLLYTSDAADEAPHV
jgi:glycosyltransferase involved in cell wall biosynthesis